MRIRSRLTRVSLFAAFVLAGVAPLLLVEAAGARLERADAANADATLLAAGDIADCGSPGDEQTAAILDAEAGVVAPLGDTAYESGTAAEFAHCYAPTWGRAKARTRPAVGNHEYGTPGAAGYFGYFGDAAGEPGKGYYSYDLGGWHVVVLNSECAAVGGCGAGSPQERWLREDLSASTADCTLAYWHAPRWSSGRHGGNGGYDAFWRALHDHGAELVLSGHDHAYERFAPQNPSGVRDGVFGIRQFVVGTGGRALYPEYRAAANSEVFQAHTFGVLKLTLKTSGYDWRFVPVAGSGWTDLGGGVCHGRPGTVPPTVELSEPRRAAVVRGRVRLVAHATDDERIRRVEFSAGAFESHAFSRPYAAVWDTRGVPDGRSRVVVRAVDTSGNVATATRTVIVDNTPPDTRLVAAPPARTGARSARFRFASSEGGSSFECRLDGGAWRPCPSPKTYRRLTRGAHVLLVRAVDRAGNRDRTPARRAWRVS